jgi:death-on-curing protein
VKESVFLTLEECLVLHEEQIRRFGGSAGLRDPGLLESALARPRSGYYRTLFEQAAAMLQSLAMNHCFVDGNKRMAVGCAFIFLDWNGFEINVGGEEAEKFLLEKVIIGKADVAEIAAWLEAHAGAISHGSAKDPSSLSSGKKPSAEAKKKSASRKKKPAAVAKKRRPGRSGPGKA